MVKIKSTARDAFSGATYDTPPNTRRFIGDRILLHSRWWFYLRFAGIVLKSSQLAARGKYDDEEWIKASFRVFKSIEGCGGRFHLRGLDNLRKTDDPVVIISNHMGTLETVIFPGIIVPFRLTTFVVKDNLVKGPIFGPIMRSRNPIVVGRKNPRQDLRTVLAEGEKTLNKGYSLVIFPQSTRTINFEPEKFNTLGVKLAKKAGIQVIPTAIKTDFWGPSKIIKGFGPLKREKHIYMAFGEPMTIQGSGKEEHHQIIEFIAGHLNEWQDKDAG
jgi:1-acyl-sn-glycerol-3-phosphate acyltransferase